jgi:hypothetical protein
VPFLEFGNDIAQFYAMATEKNKCVIEKIRGLVDELITVARDRGKCQFDAFFADFLRNPFRTLGDKGGRVALLRRALQSIRYCGLEGTEKIEILTAHDWTLIA